MIYIVFLVCEKIIVYQLTEQSNKNLKEYFEKENAKKDIEFAKVDIENTINTLKQKLPLNTGGGQILKNIEYLKDSNKVIYHYQNIEKSKIELPKNDNLRYKNGNKILDFTIEPSEYN